MAYRHEDLPARNPDYIMPSNWQILAEVLTSSQFLGTVMLAALGALAAVGRFLPETRLGRLLNEAAEGLEKSFSVRESNPPPEFRGDFPCVLPDRQAREVHRIVRGGKSG